MMNTSSLTRVLAAAHRRLPADAWTDARATIQTQRSVVDSFLVETREPVYGFNTLVGHLDDQPSGDDVQDLILSAHLIGPRSLMSAHMLDLVTACAAERLHHGHTGISPTAYDAVLESMTGTAAEGAWTSSYSSGDVVPAAWWVAQRVEPHITQYRRGDVIALINGSFYGAALGIRALLVAGGQINRFLRRYSEVTPFVTLRQQVDGSVLQSFAPTTRHVVQRPVSLRDAGPLVVYLLQSMTRVADAADARLRSPSGNPLFEFDHGTRAVSQNSFLDFRLSAALDGMIDAVRLAAGVTQRLIAHLVDDSTPAGVQPAKVARALLDGLDASLGARIDVVGDQSHGVEDLRDVTTLRAGQVLVASQSLEQILDVYDAAHSAAHSDRPALTPAVIAQAIGLTGVLDLDPTWVDALR